ncbi:membrane protein insertion efficiency factor YidD [bacterium]|nr:membrane protein insertion efficiency factor YidD [bacterium]
MVRWLVLKLIRLYQHTLSYDHGYLGRLFLNVRYCRFTPSCSMYTYNAIDKYGVIKGLTLGLNRFAKCHTGTPMGTYDPVK